MKTIDSKDFFILDAIDGCDWMATTAYGTRDNRRRAFKLLLKRLKLGEDGLSESFIETELEGYDRRTGMSATLTATSGTQTLLVEALYWGVRRMIENISADKTK
jgi:hypothetical protein